MADAEHGQGVAPAGAEPPKHRKKYMVVGTIVAILLVCLGAVLMKQAIRRQAPPAVPQAAGETGIVRLQELVQAHPAYGDLQKLLQERKELKARLQESTELAAPLAVQPPEVEQKPFDDSVWQKNAQDVIGRRAEIERAQKKAAADYKASTEEDYKARRDAINAEYLNAILNIKIKLDNREAMKLTDETVAKLNADLDDIEAERSGRQIALYRDWQQEIEGYAKASVEKDFAASHEDIEKLQAQRQAEAAKAQSEAQHRDIAVLSEQMQSSAARQQQALAVQDALTENEQQVLALESKILNDIASKAAKVAILHHFTLVICDPARSLTSLLPDAFRPSAGPDVPEKYVKTISVDATDVTDEVLSELESDPPAAEDASDSGTP